jgi:hypothetical protein
MHFSTPFFKIELTMKNKTNHFLSFIVLLVFIALAIGSKVNKIHMNAFNYYSSKEAKSESGVYLIKNNGEKVVGEKVSWKTGLLVKDQIKIDDQKFKISEIKGYRSGNIYYGRYKAEYIKRIVHGNRINVYVMFTDVTTTSTTPGTGFTRTRTYTRTDHFSQKGETGEMVAFGGQGDIKKLLADCPLSVQMAELSNKKMRKEIKVNPNYLNSIFEVYNNDCKE